jgi:transcriptional regulator GlxA family with amidase domain
VTAGLDLALWIVERRFGADLASAVARELEYEPRGVVWHPRADEGRAAAATPSAARS